MATILGSAGNSSYGAQVTVDVSAIAGSGRTGIVCTSVNGELYGVTDAHAVSGFTTVFSVVGTGHTPGLGVFYGPLDGVSSVTAIAPGGATHSDIVVFAVDDADFDAGSLALSTLVYGYKGGDNNNISTTFPNQSGEGGWIGILGTGNIDRVVGLLSLTEDAFYHGTIYSALHAFAGDIPIGGFNNQAAEFSINSLDNYSVMTVTWLDAGGGATVPTVPTSVVATPGDQQATVTWNAPASDGGSAVTSYDVEYSGGVGGGSASGRAWVFGDVYGAPNTANVDAVAAMIDGKWQAGDIVVLAGDCVQDDPPTTAKYNGLIAAVFDVLQIDPTNRTQVLAVPGNHDYDRGLFNAAFGTSGDLWSTHVIGGARWILLDSMNAGAPNYDPYNPGATPAQLTWLDGQLASPFGGPTYAVMHHPRKSSYNQTSPDTYNNNTVLDSLYTKLYDANVDYIFHGHTPNFELTKKIDQDWYLRSDGFRQIGTGTGGWSHHSSSSFNNALMNASDGSGTVVIAQQFSDSAGGGFGATLVEWSGSASTIQYFSTDGITRHILPNDPLNGSSTTLIAGATSPEVIAGLTNDTLYDFGVRANNAIGPGPWANDTATPTGGGAPTVPSIPANFSAFPGDGQVSLSWTQTSTGGSPITGYDIAWQASPSGGWNYDYNISPANLDYIVTPLTNGTLYEFGVQAHNAVGPSGWTSIIYATPVVSGGGGGNWPIHIDLGNIEMIDWWEWSWDPANNDAFQVKARASGPDYYASVGGSGDGLSPGSPWSIWTAKSQIDNRQLPPGSKVHLAPGNYPVIGQFTGGGSGTTGWVSIVGPPASQGVAEISGPYDRYWSLKDTASRIQFVRLKAENPNMVNDFNNWVGGGGGAPPNPPVTSDSAMASQLGYAVNSIGFQLDGSSNQHPGPMVTVSCHGVGVGEAFGSYRAGNYFALGCLAENCALASPNGRSGFSFSITTAGAGTGNSIDNLVLNQAGTVGFYMGTFGCVAAHTAQMIDSSGIGDVGVVWDGNGYNLPTDAQSSESGNSAQQCNVAINVGMHGFNSYNGIDGSIYCINNLSMFTGAHAYHRANNWIMGYNPSLILNTPNGTGWPYLFHRYPEQYNLTPGQKPYHVAGNVSIHDPNTPSYTQAGFNSTWSTGVSYDTNRGNVSSTSTNDSINAVVSSPSAILETSTRDHYVADLHPKSGGPTQGAAYGADLVWDIDFMGLPFVDRGAGRVDAGIYGGGTATPPVTTVPDPPTSLSATPGDGEVDLTWSASVDDGGSPITSYSVEYRNITDGGAWTSGGITAATTRVVNGLINDKLHEFRVLATNSVGNSAWSGTTQATPVGVASPPDAPTNLVATPGDEQVGLTWSVPATNGSTITGYVVEHRPSSGGAWTATGTANPSATITLLSNGVEYAFQVKATSSEGDSLYSSTTLSTPIGAAASVPDPPTSFAATANGTGTPDAAWIDMTWVAPVDDGGEPILGYRVRTAITVYSPGNVNSYAIAAPVGIDQSYWVAAYNTVGESAASNVVVVSTYSVPSAVSSLTANVGTEQVTLNWTVPASDGDRSIFDYLVEYRVSGGTWGSWGTPAGLTETVTGLVDGTSYNFRVSPRNNVGYGPAVEVNGTPVADVSMVSDFAGVATIFANLSQPVNLDATITGGGGLTSGNLTTNIQLSATISGNNFLIGNFESSMTSLIQGIAALQGTMEGAIGTTQMLAYWDGSQWVFGDLMVRGASTWDAAGVATYDGSVWEP